MCCVHENIFKQYHETCFFKTTPSKCSSKYDEQEPVPFWVKTVQLKRQKLDQTGMFWRTNKAAVHA